MCADSVRHRQVAAAVRHSVPFLWKKSYTFLHKLKSACGASTTTAVLAGQPAVVSILLLLLPISFRSSTKNLVQKYLELCSTVVSLGTCRIRYCCSNQTRRPFNRGCCMRLRSEGNGHTPGSTVVCLVCVPDGHALNTPEDKSGYRNHRGYRRPPGPTFKDQYTSVTKRVPTPNSTFSGAYLRDRSKPPFSALTIFLLWSNRALKVGPGDVR